MDELPPGHGRNTPPFQVGGKVVPLFQEGVLSQGKKRYEIRGGTILTIKTITWDRDWDWLITFEEIPKKYKFEAAVFEEAPLPEPAPPVPTT